MRPCGSLLLLAVALLPARALPDDAPAEAWTDESVHKELAHAKSLFEAEHWSDAITAYRRTLGLREGSTEILRRLAEIEGDLRYCLYRKQAPLPTVQEMFGSAAKELIHAERRLTLDYPGGPAGPEWVAGGDLGMQFLRRKFGDEVAVEFDAALLDKETSFMATVYLCFDEERWTGYVVAPGVRTTDPNVWKRWEGEIVVSRVEGKSGTPKEVGRKGPKSDTQDLQRDIRVARRGETITLSVGGKPLMTATDTKYRCGEVAVGATGMKRVCVRGVLDRAYYEKVLKETLDRGLDAWAAKNYARAEVLPRWILDRTK